MSAVRGAGLSELERRVRQEAGLSSEPEENEMILADARQRAALGAARAALAEAKRAAADGYGEEIVALPLKGSLKNLSSVVGEDVSEEILDMIFSRFCIGK
jgi:tRNA modification GTPase